MCRGRFAGVPRGFLKILDIYTNLQNATGTIARKVMSFFMESITCADLHFVLLFGDH